MMNLRHLSLTRNDLGVKAKNQDHAVRKSPPITSCAVAQHYYNGDVRFLWEKMELWPLVKFKLLNRLSQNLSQLIMSTSGMFVPSLVKIRSRGTSEQIGEMSLSCDFIFFLRHAQRSNPLTDFDAWWLKMRGITQVCAFSGLKYLILTFDPYLPQ